MFTAGPSRTPTFSAWHSLPRALPMRSTSARSKDEAVAHPAGKQTALMLSLTPRWSPVSSCLRSPWGPSLIIIAGMSRRWMALVCQKSPPEQRLAFSSRVSCCNNSGMFMCARTSYNSRTTLRKTRFREPVLRLLLKKARKNFARRCLHDFYICSANTAKPYFSMVRLPETVSPVSTFS